MIHEIWTIIVQLVQIIRFDNDYIVSRIVMLQNADTLD